MANSGISIDSDSRTGRFVRYLFVLAVAFPFGIPVPLWSADKIRTPEVTIAGSDGPSSSRDSPANVSAVRTLSAQQVAELACQRAAMAKLVLADARARKLESHFSGDEVSTKIVASFQNALAMRLQQSASANALKLHYAIAGCMQAERLLLETEEVLSQQEKAQVELVDRGIPIPDPILIDRLKVTTEDKRLENASKLATLRMQLATLIGTEHACSHAPEDEDSIMPSDCNACEWIQRALECRCDYTSLKSLSSTIHEDTLEVWDHIAGFLSGVPSLPGKLTFWKRILKPRCSRQELANAVSARRAWMTELIRERSQQIATEVDVAYEKKKSAALRWVNAGEQVRLWERRISQLNEMARVRGTMAEQFEAKLNRIQSKAAQLERWVEWHVASVELCLAVGAN